MCETQDRGRKVMCHKCKEKFFKDELIQRTKTTRYCKSCNDAITKDREEYNQLYDYIRANYNMQQVDGRILKIIKDLRTINSISYKDIGFTLHYLLDVMKAPRDIGTFFKIEGYYETSKKHYQIVERVKSTAVNSVIEEVDVKVSSVCLAKADVSKTRLIDLSLI